MRPLLALAVLLALIPPALAYPALHPYVNDFAELLTPAEEAELNVLAAAIEQNTSVEFAIVTVRTTDGEDRILYASRTGEQNGVGQEGKDNGVVILWTVDNEHGGAIAMGRGIESILNDARVARVGRAHREEFDRGAYYAAFSGIMVDLRAYLQGEDALTTPEDSRCTINGEPAPCEEVLKIALIVLVIIVIILIAIARSNRQFGGPAMIFLPGMMGSGRGGGRMGGGFSGGGFGGGSFGGGGGRF